jgi:3-oxo-5alpha-steroid 4-dehydrogenase
MAPTGTEGLVYSGGEDAYPFNEIARPAPRGHLAKTKRSTGWLLMQILAAAATDAGALASYDTRIDRLITDGEAVVGVQGQRFGETVSLRARRGVVLTAGGFVFNDDMLRQHCPPLVKGTFKVGTEGDDGRGIRMAQAIGASVRNMYAGEVSLPITPPRGLINGILVNGQGQRFINEDTYMGRVGQRSLYEQDGEVYLILDEAAYEVNWMGLAASSVCETPAQLEAEIGLPPGSLESTVALYNRHAETGADPLFHKGPQWVRPLTGPLGAVDLRIGPAPYAPFTLGGLETTVEGAVRNLAGEAIGGLFAAGRTTAGVCAFGYASGMSIGDSTMFGRFAGASAASA